MLLRRPERLQREAAKLVIYFTTPSIKEGAKQHHCQMFCYLQMKKKILTYKSGVLQEKFVFGETVLKLDTFAIWNVGSVLQYNVYAISNKSNTTGRCWVRAGGPLKRSRHWYYFLQYFAFCSYRQTQLSSDSFQFKQVTISNHYF